jgi:hypothetical protein
VLQRFEQFIKERQYIINVSPSTIEWYEQSFKWLDTETPTADDIKAVVMRMRDLQKRLGHASLEMTRRCANLTTSDLQAVHGRLSLLGNAR